MKRLLLVATLALGLGDAAADPPLPPVPQDLAGVTILRWDQNPLVQRNVLAGLQARGATLPLPTWHPDLYPIDPATGQRMWSIDGNLATVRLHASQGRTILATYGTDLSRPALHAINHPEHAFAQAIREGATVQEAINRSMSPSVYSQEILISLDYLRPTTFHNFTNLPRGTEVLRVNTSPPWPRGHDGTSPFYQQRPVYDPVPSTALGWGATGLLVGVSSYASFIEHHAEDPNTRLGAAVVGVLSNPLAVPTEAVVSITKFVAQLPNDILTARTRDDFYLAYWSNPEVGRALWDRYSNIVRFNRGSADDNFRAWAASARFAAFGRKDAAVTPQDLITTGAKKPWTFHPRWPNAQKLIPTKPGACP